MVCIMFILKSFLPWLIDFIFYNSFRLFAENTQKDRIKQSDVTPEIINETELLTGGYSRRLTSNHAHVLIFTSLVTVFIIIPF